MNDIINDEVLGSLKYNNGAWVRRLEIPVLSVEMAVSDTHSDAAGMWITA